MSLYVSAAKSSTWSDGTQWMAADQQYVTTTFPSEYDIATNPMAVAGTTLTSPTFTLAASTTIYGLGLRLGTHTSATNSYLSVTLTVGGSSQTCRVLISDLPSGYGTANGGGGWVYFHLPASLSTGGSSQTCSISAVVSGGGIVNCWVTSTSTHDYAHFLITNESAGSSPGLAVPSSLTLNDKVIICPTFTDNASAGTNVSQPGTYPVVTFDEQPTALANPTMSGYSFSVSTTTVTTTGSNSINLGQGLLISGVASSYTSPQIIGQPLNDTWMAAATSSGTTFTITTSVSPGTSWVSGGTVSSICTIGRGNHAAVTSPSTSTPYYDNFFFALSIGQGCVLKYATTASVTLALMLLGSVELAGTLALGDPTGLISSGTPSPIPASSTAHLCFGQNSAAPTNVDWGIIGYAGHTFLTCGSWSTRGTATTASLTQVSATASSPTLGWVSGPYFHPGDVGKSVSIPGAGAAGATLTATVTAFVSQTQLTLGTNASTTVASATLSWIDPLVRTKLSYTGGSGTTTNLLPSGSGSLTTLDTTGWLVGDRFGLGGTESHSGAGTEWFLINAISGTTITLAQSDISSQTVNTSAAHQGGAYAFTGYTSPGTLGTVTFDARAHLVHLTRNVKIHGHSTTYGAYVNLVNGTDYVRFTEFYHVGSGTSNKRGLDLSPTSIYPADVYGCSFHDEATNISGSTPCGVVINGTSADNFRVRACVALNVMATSAVGVAFYVVSATTGSNYVFDYLATVKVGQAMVSADVGGVFTNIWCCSSNSAQTVFFFNEANIYTGTISNLLANNVPSTLYLTIWGGVDATGMPNKITNVQSVRSYYQAFSLGSVRGLLVLEDFSAIGTAGGGQAIWDFATYGNIEAQIYIRRSTTEYKLFTGDSASQGTGPDVFLGHAGGTDGIYFEDSTFGYTNAGSMNINISAGQAQAFFRNCYFGSGTELANQGSLYPTSFIGSSKHDLTNGNSKTWYREGTIYEDWGIYDYAPSLRMVPRLAIEKLRSKKWSFPVQKGQTAVISVKVRTSTTADGAAYTGTMPRLAVERNPAVGLSTDCYAIADANAQGGAITGAFGETLTVLAPALTSPAQVSAVSWVSGTSFTVTTSVPHGLSVANTIAIWGVAGCLGLNGIWTVATVPDSTHFTITANVPTSNPGTLTATSGLISYQSGAFTDDGVVSYWVECDGGPSGTTPAGWVNVDSHSVT